MTQAGERDATVTRQGAAEAAAPASPAPTQLGRYQLRGVLGRGGMGVVYEAWDPQLARVVALKAIPAARGGRPHPLTARFFREVRAAAALRHPHIVPVHDAGEDEGTLWLTMDRVEGEALDELLAREGALPPRRAVELLLPVVQALAHAHAEGIIHRDVKPENILVGPNGHPWLTDFGLAQDEADPDRLTRTGHAVGTPAFMAPEQVRGVRVDARADVYGLGATCYELLTGRVPFAGDSALPLAERILREDPAPPRRFVPQLAPDLEVVVLRCLEKDPAARYASAAELAADLQRFLRGEGVLARRPSAWRRWTRRVLRRPGVALGLTLAAVGLSGGAALSLPVLRELRGQEQVRLQLEERRREALASAAREEARRAALASAAVGATTEEQLAAYGRLVAAFPDLWEGRVARARLLRRRCHEERVRGGDPARAREAAERALADLAAAEPLAPDPGALLLLRAELERADLRDPAAARRSFARLAEASPGALADYARARLALDAGREEQAWGAAERALAARPDLAPARALHAGLLLRRGRPGEALEALDALGAQPELAVETARVRAEALQALGAPADALLEAERAVALDPADPASALILGRLRLAADNLGGALSALSRAAQLAPGDPEAPWLLARVALRQQQRQEALAWLAEAARRAELPRLVRALRRLGLPLPRLRLPAGPGLGAARGPG